MSKFKKLPADFEPWEDVFVFVVRHRCLSLSETARICSMSKSHVSRVLSGTRCCHPQKVKLLLNWFHFKAAIRLENFL